MGCELRDCEVETMLGRLPNGVVVLATEIIVTTWMYFGKMSINPHKDQLKRVRLVLVGFSAANPLTYTISLE